MSTDPCRSPYCECDPGKCTHPGFHDARGTVDSIEAEELSKLGYPVAFETPAEIEQLLHFGRRHGYGRAMQLLQEEWSKMLQREWGLPRSAADRGALMVCSWCDVDGRTGKPYVDPDR